MLNEHPAFKQWKEEGVTSEAVQAMQDARANFVQAQEQLRVLTSAINALAVARQAEIDLEKKSELDVELMRLQNARVEIEKFVADYEHEFEKRNISLDKPTMH